MNKNKKWTDIGTKTEKKPKRQKLKIHISSTRLKAVTINHLPAALQLQASRFKLQPRASILFPCCTSGVRLQFSTDNLKCQSPISTFNLQFSICNVQLQASSFNFNFYLSSHTTNKRVKPVAGVVWYGQLLLLLWFYTPARVESLFQVSMKNWPSLDEKSSKSL